MHDVNPFQFTHIRFTHLRLTQTSYSCYRARTYYYILPNNNVTTGRATEGLDSKEIQTFQESVYSAVKNKEELIDCAVCLDDYEDRDMLRLIPCLHAFHTNCIDEWLVSHTTCPHCCSDLLKPIFRRTTLNAGDIVIDVMEDRHGF
ncbi:hypothetical protein MKW98_028779 [Papaver atlanticum]|uniref:RING-type domain-containing protein n=1 Tax=Papaver atlanticum TaxID=357466 RepID=A0AAD4XBT5_9MAGN|nr:hypothetical protein MKW98_028779 [Papaver atlanticum]